MAAKDDLEAVRLIVEALKGFDGGDQERIIRWAREKAGLPAAPGGMQPRPPGAPGGEGAGKPPVEPGGDIRSFITAKNPQSDTHLAAAVAYFYRFKAPADQRKDRITAADLQDACRMADRDRLANPGQTLINAHHGGLLDKAERGSYAINAVGENLVAMALPGGGADRKAIKGKPKKRKKKAKKEDKKKAMKRKDRGAKAGRK